MCRETPSLTSNENYLQTLAGVVTAQITHFSIYAVLSYLPAATSTPIPIQTTAPPIQVVNSAAPSTPTVAPPSTAAPQATPQPGGGGSGPPIGAIAGGVVGGILAVVGAVLAYRYSRPRVSAAVVPIQPIEGAPAPGLEEPLLQGETLDTRPL